MEWQVIIFGIYFCDIYHNIFKTFSAAQRTLFVFTLLAFEINTSTDNLIYISKNQILIPKLSES